MCFIPKAHVEKLVFCVKFCKSLNLPVFIMNKPRRAVHMRDQRFSKLTLNDIRPFQKKHPLIENFTQFLHLILPPNQDFLGNMFDGIEEFEKLPQSSLIQ